jgi:hypothetical protein
MTNHHVLHLVRQTLAQWLGRRHPGEHFQPQESILIRDGFYCGRRIQFADYQAVWFAEEGSIKIYSGSGELLEKLSASESVEQGAFRRAA